MMMALGGFGIEEVEAVDLGEEERVFFVLDDGAHEERGTR